MHVWDTDEGGWNSLDLRRHESGVTSVAISEGADRIVPGCDCNVRRVRGYGKAKEDEWSLQEVLDAC